MLLGSWTGILVGVLVAAYGLAWAFSKLPNQEAKPKPQVAHYETRGDSTCYVEPGKPTLCGLTANYRRAIDQATKVR